MFKNNSILYYDKLYHFKNYQVEVAKLVDILKEFIEIKQQKLLDVACGTGLHLQYLSNCFEVEGMDIAKEFIDIARKRNPGLVFHQGNMINFHLAKKYDLITCLFSSIGYVKTVRNLYRTMKTMASHLNENGLVIIEPWFTPVQWNPGYIHSLSVDEPNLKIIRMSTSLKKGNLSIFDFHYLIGTPESTEHLVEHHEMGLFDDIEMKKSLTDNGFEAYYYPDGISGRGLYIGRKNK